MIGSYGAVWIAIALAAVALRRRAATLVLTVVVAVFAADGLATGLKQAFGRDRPYVDRPDPEPLMDTHLDLGFPSGHAATSFAGATVLAARAARGWPCRSTRSRPSSPSRASTWASTTRGTSSPARCSASPSALPCGRSS